MSFSGDLYPTAGATSVLTTKGDMVDFDTARQRFGIGSTGQVLTVAGALPTWATLTTADSVLTTQGDVLYESGSGLARLGFGTSGHVLTTKGTGANPVWEASGGGGASTAQVIITSGGHITTTATSLVDATGVTLTLPNTGGTLDCLCNSMQTVTVNVGDSLRFALTKNTTPLTYTTEDPPVAGQYTSFNVTCLADGDSDSLKLQWSTAGGNTGTIRVTASWGTPTISAFAV